jgi:hypothetical protein
VRKSAIVGRWPINFLEYTMNQQPVKDIPTEPGTPGHVDDTLDEALEESFPASDPVAISDGKSPRRTPEPAPKQ